MEVSQVPGKTLEARKWDEFVKNSPQGSLYTRHAYLCASYPDWQALILQSSGTWEAAFPFFPRKHYGFRVVWQPLFSQYTGVLLRPTEKDHALAYYETQKRLLETLLGNLPHFQLFNIQFPPTFDYPLPFVWQDFQLFCRYTYQLPLAPKPVFHQLRKNLQRNIRQAEKAGWTIQRSRDTGSFAQLMEQTLGPELGPNKMLQPVAAIADALLTHCLGTLLACMDKTGQMRAGILLGRDQATTYYLMGAADPDARREGALSQLLWASIQQAADHTQVFDFEGSMQRNREHFFRGFGAHPVPYLRIYRNQLPLKKVWALFGY